MSTFLFLIDFICKTKAPSLLFETSESKVGYGKLLENLLEQNEMLHLMSHRICDVENVKESK